MSDAAARSALAAEIHQALGIRPELAPCEPERLHQHLRGQEKGLLLLDLSLVPAVLPVLQSGRLQVIVVTTLRHDPRAVKLAHWGAPVLHLSQVPGFLAQLRNGRANLTSFQSLQPSPTPAPPLLSPASSHDAVVTVLHSPKGGVGTSTLAAHLASCWARQGLRVLLVDLSAYGASAILCKARQQGTGLEALASTLEMAPDCLTEDFDLFPYLVPLPVSPGRLDLLTGARPRLMDRFTPQHVLLLLSACRRLPYDALVVDTASEPTVRTLAALESAHRLILVATSDYTTCWNLIHLQELLDTLRLKAERLLVFNRFTGSGIRPDELQQRLGLPLAAVFPEHPLLQELGNQGRPWELEPGDPFADAVAQWAAALHTPAVRLHG
ncbi:MAG TPA: AAA family ATPase [Symbiobacteriaceae bacterium]